MRPRLSELNRVGVCLHQDGTMDIWDLLDQTHSAVVSNAPICSTPITAIEFSPFTPSNVAVADSEGNLRIIAVPTTFTLPLSHELAMTAAFFKKEELKTRALRKRRRRWKQMQKVKEAQTQSEAVKDTESATTDTLPLQLESDQSVQERYEKMLVAFKRKLGIKE